MKNMQIEMKATKYEQSERLLILFKACLLALKSFKKKRIYCLPEVR